METYHALALRALEIMDIPCDRSESLASILDRLLGAILLPASTTEGEIMMLSKQTADLIDNRAPVSQIELGLKDLESFRWLDLFD